MTAIKLNLMKTNFKTAVGGKKQCLKHRNVALNQLKPLKPQKLFVQPAEKFPTAAGEDAQDGKSSITLQLVNKSPYYSLFHFISNLKGHTVAG